MRDEWSLLLSPSYVADKLLMSTQNTLICSFVVCFVPGHRASEMVLRAHKCIIEIEPAVIDLGSIPKNHRREKIQEPGPHWHLLSCCHLGAQYVGGICNYMQ